MVFHAIGEDWVFLSLLGVLMALLSFTMDFIIEKCQSGKISKTTAALVVLWLVCLPRVLSM